MNKPKQDNQRTAGKLGARASPWGKFPACNTQKAIQSHVKFKQSKGKQS